VIALALLALGVWSPPHVTPANAALADVLARMQAAQALPPAYGQRHEQWTYQNGTTTIPVSVAVRGAEFRADVPLAGAVYEGGVLGGVPWRADGNGVAHATLDDEQGDPVDRLPRALLPFDPADCTLAGEARVPARAWVIAVRPPNDRAHWLFVDEASGRIVREQTREGRRVVTIEYDDFAPLDAVVRPRHWRVTSGDRADDVDVRVDAITPGPVADAELAMPRPRLFTAPAGAPGRVPLPVGSTDLPYHLPIDVVVDGRPARFLLDTGTQSLMLSSEFARRLGLHATLGHAIVKNFAVSSYALADASVMVLPLGSLAGIVGYDFFVGHVLHVDELHDVVELTTPEAAASVFVDPLERVVPASYDEGFPVTTALLDGVGASRFVLDTGSPDIEVSTAFLREDPTALNRWTRVAFPTTSKATAELHFLEGTVRIEAYRIARVQLGPVMFTDTIAGVQVDDPDPDAIELPYDGIIGNTMLRFLDLWFDYDGGRLAMRAQR
jgi:predicted aspartyl protease